MPAAPLRGAALTTYVHPYDVHFAPQWKWSRSFTILDDHRAFRFFPQFASWTKADHQREAEHALRNAITIYAAYVEVADSALHTYGAHGSLISAIVRDHFPVETRDVLRTLAYRTSRENQRSLAHWKAAGRSVTTWRKQRATMESK